MNNDQKDKSILGQILKAIGSGKVKMRPKWHFVIRGALFGVGVILAGLALLYLVSFIIFILHQSGLWFAPAFGLGGVAVFLGSLPWVLVIMALILIILAEVLVKRYSFAYRKPLVYSALAIILLVILGSLAVARTTFHKGLMIQAQDQRLPVAGGLYRRYGLRPLKNLAAGEVREVLDGSIKLKNLRGETVEVLIYPQTRFPRGRDLAVGDRVVVLGPRQNGAIKALGIRKIGGRLPLEPKDGFRILK